MDVVESVKAIDLENGNSKTFSNKQCKYTYRSSIFKSKEKNRYLITSAIFKLNKEPDDLEISYFERKSRYGSLEEELKSIAQKPYTIHDVMQAVINQRVKTSTKEYVLVEVFLKTPLLQKKNIYPLVKKSECNLTQ